ncbi:MAG: HAMP domain-containing sensor histidine kinase [Verrucomicrobiales bacterium]|nr:HAMP domain-containing sensor histidine kinase [Verrucomicrobiales bacterium]
MFAARHSPVWILALILISAGAVLVLGFFFSRETQVVTVEQDHAPLSRFTSELLKEVESLEELYEGRLLDVRARIGSGENTLEVASVCREIVGAEQAIIVPRNGEVIAMDLRDSDRSVPLPHPMKKGSGGIRKGIILDFDDLERGAFLSGFQWLDRPGEALHFATMLDGDTAFVLRIDKDAAIRAADEWLESWVPDVFAPVQASGMTASVTGPLKNVIVSTGEVATDLSPNLILPVSSVFGDWSVSSHPKTEVVTSYNLPFMVGSAALFVVLVVAGVFGFTQQCRAVRLAEQRVSFVNRVSHELRTPMTNILLNVDLLEDSVPEESRIAAKRLGLIREEAGRLSRLLENVLCFSRRDKLKGEEEDAGQTLRLVPCSLFTVIDAVLDQFGPSLSRKNIEVERGARDVLHTVLADEDALRQIISNLISNVEKYAAAGGKLEFRAARSDSGDSIVLSVIDGGPGIPVSESARIFRPFERLSEATKEGVSGTGLGLSIARELAVSMNGSLEIDFKNHGEGGGACFILTLPMSANNIVRIAS